MPLADGLDGRHPGLDLGRRRRVVVVGADPGPLGQDPGLERRADDEAAAALDGGRELVVEDLLVE